MTNILITVVIMSINIAVLSIKRSVKVLLHVKIIALNKMDINVKYDKILNIFSKQNLLIL